VNGPNATVASAPVRPARDLSWVGPALVIVFAALLTAAAARLVAQPGHVGSVQVVNPAEQAVDVDVKQPGGPWAPLGAVEAKSSTTVYDAVDVGGPWVIRFRTSDEVLAQVRRSRDALEHDHWRIVVPTRAD
jgi:hypothetical protein